MNDYKIFTAFMLVSILLVPIVIAQSAARQGESSYTVTSVGGPGGGDGNVNRTDGSSCSEDNQCVNSYCVHSICRSASPFCGDAFCDSGETCSSCSGDCGGCPVAAAPAAPSGGAAAPTTTTPTPTPTPAPTPAPSVIPPVEVVTVNIPVTETKAVQEVVTAIKPSDLGVTEIKIENIKVTKIGVAETTTTTQAPILEKVVDEAIAVVTEESAKQVLQKIKQAVSFGSSSPVSVSTMVEVFEVKEKTTGKTAFASKITLTIKSDKDLKDVNIVEVIPKSVAASISEVIFLGEQPKVLQADPVVQWEFAEVKKDETKDLSYQVAKKIETLETKTVAVAEAPVAVVEPEAPSLTYVYIVIGILIAVVVVYLLYKKFSKVSLGKSKHFKYNYKPK